MDKETKACPILRAGNQLLSGTKSDCIEKKCAWWVTVDFDSKGSCGIQDSTVVNITNSLLSDLKRMMSEAVHMGLREHALEMRQQALTLKQQQQDEKKQALENKWKP